jgi:hypothetical protein
MQIGRIVVLAAHEGGRKMIDDLVLESRFCVPVSSAP